MESQSKESSSWLDRPLTSLLPKLNLETLLIVLILAVAVFSRFYNLDLRVMSHDEVNHVVPSYDFFSGRGYRYDPVTHGPMQFHLIALSFFLLGDSDFSARVPAALFSVAAIAVVLLAFRPYLGRRGAIIAGILFLISPYMLFYGRYTRNEGFSQLFSVLTLYGVLRYLDRGDRFSLYFLTAVTALHVTDKATGFIYTAQMLIFLAVVFLVQVTRQEWPSGSARKQFIFTMGMTLLLIFVALGMGVWGADMAKSGLTPLQNLIDAAHTGLLVSLAGAVILGLASIFLLVSNLGLKTIRSQRSFDLLILLGTMILPQLSALPAQLLGWNPIDYSAGNMPRMAGLILALFVISAVIGVWWSPRLWVSLAAIFYSIFTVLFTSVFTNGQGFFTGLVGALGYWLSQQSVNRGSQPWYYYALIQIPMYEYLPALGSLVAFYFGIRYNRFITRPDFAPAHQPEVIEPDAVEITDPDSEEAQKAGPADHMAGFTGRRPVPVLILLLYWSLTSLVAYSLAGEKMPWLTVHITAGMILAAGWGFGYLVDTTRWQKIVNRKGLLALVLMPVFLTSLASAFGVLLGDKPPFQGSTLEQLQATSTFLLSALAALLSGYGFFYFLRDWASSQVLRLVSAGVFVILAVFTARTAYQAAFINYDNATEMLVYAHAARGPKDVLAQIEEISKRTTRGKDIAVAYDNDALYPYWWYLRDYPNKKWFTDKPTRDLVDSPIIVAGEANYTKLEPIVKDKFVEFEYMRLWWPMQDYFNLTWDRVASALGNPQMRAALFDIWLNRDYSYYAQLTNSQTLTLENWQPSARMKMYIRKDILSQIWTYGAQPVINTEVKADPYAEKTINLAPDQVVGETAQMNAPRGVAVAADNSLYVADSRNNRILHLSATGEQLQAWGTLKNIAEGEAPGGTFNEPWGVAVGPDGSVYVTDTWNHRVEKFTAEGQFVTMWGYFGQAEKPEAFWGPRGIAVDAEGHVYVMDTGNKRVVIFNSNGEYITQFGSSGMDDGQFDEPVGVALDANGNVYVTDTWNQRVQVFAPDSQKLNYSMVKKWDVNGWFGQSLDNKPFITVDKSGNVYVTDPEGYRVLEFDGEGQFVRGWGDYSTGTDGFGMAAAVAVDSENHVWVSDAGNNRLLRFSIP